MHQAGDIAIESTKSIGTQPVTGITAWDVAISVVVIVVIVLVWVWSRRQRRIYGPH